MFKVPLEMTGRQDPLEPRVKLETWETRATQGHRDRKVKRVRPVELVRRARADRRDCPDELAQPEMTAR